MTTLKTENKVIGLKTSGKEAMRDGKSVFLSGHIRSPQYNGISGNILNTDGFYFTELQQNVTDAIMHFAHLNGTQKTAVN